MRRHLLFLDLLAVRSLQSQTPPSPQDPDDISRNNYINEAFVRHTFETFRKVLPVDIYLETGSYGWSGTLNQPSGTITERIVKLRPIIGSS